MKLIVAVSKNWGIGKGGNLLFHIPEDMKFFKKITTGHTVIMGRKTLESFPQGKPLKDRTNVVLTRDKNYKKDGVIVVHSVEDAVPYFEDAFVIGGGEVYRQLLPYCDTVYITKVNETVENADTFFPNLDLETNWRKKELLLTGECCSVKYVIYKYMKS